MTQYEFEESRLSAVDAVVEQTTDKKMQGGRFPLNGNWIDIGNSQEYQKAKNSKTPQKE